MIVIDFTYPPQLLTATRARYVAEVTELFDAETERLTEREQQAQEADTIRDWLDTDSLPPSKQGALTYGDAVDLDEWQNDWQNTYNDLRGGL